MLHCRGPRLSFITAAWTLCRCRRYCCCCCCCCHEDCCTSSTPAIPHTLPSPPGAGRAIPLPPFLSRPPSLDSFLFLITCHGPWVSIPSLQALCHVSFASNQPESACVTLQPDEIYSRADAVRTARAVVVSGQRAGMAGSGAITRLIVSRCRDFCH